MNLYKNKKILIFTILSLILIPSLAFASSFVTFTADSLFKAKKYDEAAKHYLNIANKYFNEATKSETVNYIFGPDAVKNSIINKSINSAQIALYSYYMLSVCNIYLNNFSDAANSIANAFTCFSFNKTITLKSLSGNKPPETVLISQPKQVIEEYKKKISLLPIPVSYVLKSFEKVARNRYATFLKLSTVPNNSPAYNELLNYYNSLLTIEQTYSEIIINVISNELDAKKTISYDALVAFMKNYNPIDKSVTSTLDISDKIIKKINSLSISLQGTNVELATFYSVLMQKLISVNSYIKSYLATSGGK